MNARLIKNNKILVVDETLEFTFINSISSNNYITFLNNIYLNFENTENNVFLHIVNSNLSSSAFSININYEIILNYDTSSISFLKDNKIYSLSCVNCLIEIDNDGILTVRINQSSGTLDLTYLKNTNIEVQAYETNVTFIDEKTSMPEFSIATFDDSNFTVPRPIRQGVPIISTVPAAINNSSSSADIDFYDLGKGPDFKTIHFRIVCNKIMENISISDLSDMKLKIYMPNGLDTVKKATYIPMYLVQNDSTNNISIYRASYDFYVQGIFDSIEYIDGYMYCDVQVPLTIQNVMPFEFDFNLL
jgi:hypothetical protein